MTVNEVVAVVGLSQPTVSRHLAILRDAGFVIDRRDGQNVYCGLDTPAVTNCCSGFCLCLGTRGKANRRVKDNWLKYPSF